VAFEEFSAKPIVHKVLSETSVQRPGYQKRLHEWKVLENILQRTVLKTYNGSFSNGISAFILSKYTYSLFASDVEALLNAQCVALGSPTVSYDDLIGFCLRAGSAAQL